MSNFFKYLRSNIISVYNYTKKYIENSIVGLIYTVKV